VTSSGARSAALALIRAAHFQPTIAVTGFTTALALSSGCGRRSVGIGAAVLCGQLATGWSNDFIDRFRDSAAGRSDKPIVAGLVSPTLVRNCAITAGVVCVPVSMVSGWRAASVHLLAIGTAFTYNRWLKSTPFSVAPYVVAFGSLPAFVSLSLDGHHLPEPWTMVAAGLLGAGAHFINVLPDIDADASTGVRGLPQRFGHTRAVLAGTILLAASTAVVALGRWPLGVAAKGFTTTSTTAIGGVIAAAGLGRDRAARSLSLVAAASTVALYLAQNGLKTTARGSSRA